MSEELPPSVHRLEPSPYSSVTGDWIDVERTRTLLADVFIHREGLPHDWDHWPDIATLGIPNYYGWVYLALGQAAYQAGDSTSFEEYQAAAQAWLDLGT